MTQAEEFKGDAISRTAVMAKLSPLARIRVDIVKKARKVCMDQEIGKGRDRP